MREIQITNAALRAEVDLLAEASESDAVVVGSGLAGLSAAIHLARGGRQTTLLDARPYLGGRCWERRVLALQDSSPLDELGVSCRYTVTDGISVVSAADLAVGLLSAAREAGVSLLNSAEVCDLVVREEKVCGLMISGMPGLAERSPGPCLAARAVVDATGHDARLVKVLRRKLKDFYPGDVGEGFVDVESAGARLLERTGELYPGLYVAGMSAAAVYHLPRATILVDGLLESGRRVAEVIFEDIPDQQEPE
jgi:thiamine thiazole synthase